MKANLSFENLEWEEFFIGGKKGLFKISSTKSGIDRIRLNTTKGTIPYITRSEINNGINLFITEFQDEKFKKNSGNVITIGLDTQTVFYQKKSFFTGQNIQVLESKKLNQYKEPPRVYRRVDCLSQATLSDSVRLS